MNNTIYRRQPVLDEYVEGGRRAIFFDSKVVVLSEIGHVVLEGLDAGCTDFAAIRGHLLEEFGTPEGIDVDARVLEVLTDLVSTGIVSQSDEV